jgi:hypothetical protein
MKTVKQIVKDGPRNHIEITTVIDESKPKCYVVGHEWKFNSTISMEKINEGVSVETS